MRFLSPPPRNSYARPEIVVTVPGSVYLGNPAASAYLLAAPIITAIVTLMVIVMPCTAVAQEELPQGTSPGIEQDAPPEGVAQPAADGADLDTDRSARTQQGAMHTASGSPELGKPGTYAPSQGGTSFGDAALDAPNAATEHVATTVPEPPAALSQADADARIIKEQSSDDPKSPVLDPAPHEPASAEPHPFASAAQPKGSEPQAQEDEALPFDSSTESFAHRPPEPARGKQLPMVDQAREGHFPFRAANPPTSLATPTRVEPSAAPSLEGKLPPKVPQGKLTPLEILKFQVTLSESSYQSNKTPENRSELITMYERLLGPLCMQGIASTLNYAGNPPPESECAALIEKTLAIDQENPAALCSRFGLENPICRDAYKTQVAVAADTSRPNRGGANREDPYVSQLREKLSKARNDPIIKELSDKLATLEFNASQQRGTEINATNDQIRDTYRKVLRVTCVNIITRLSDPPQRSNTGQPRDSLWNEQSPFKLPAPEESAAHVKRERLIPAKCKRFIDKALKFDSRFPEALCFLHGVYSPRCIGARRFERSLSSATKPENKSDLESF